MNINKIKKPGELKAKERRCIKFCREGGKTVRIKKNLPPSRLTGYEHKKNRRLTAYRLTGYEHKKYKSLCTC